MNDKFQELANLGVGDFEHLDGTLIEHLTNTKALLCQWGASLELQDAGLYHAAYGTAGFDENFISINQREKIAKIIGKDAEEIVYQYCACDRQYFFKQFGNTEKLIFKNRFNNEQYHLSGEMLKSFCELTAANEIEIALGNPKFKSKHGSALNDLFIHMKAYLSDFAALKANKEFGLKNA